MRVLIVLPRHPQPSRFKKFEIPIPLTVALLGWAAGVLWTTTRTAYRSRLDVKLLSFFHDVNFTLCTKRGKAVALVLVVVVVVVMMMVVKHLSPVIVIMCDDVCIAT